MSSKEFNNPRYKGGGSARSPPPSRSPPPKAPPPSYPKAKAKPGRAKSRPKSKSKALDSRMNTVFQDVHQAIITMDAPSRQSKRYRPKLPLVSEVETNNPLYSSIALAHSETELSKSLRSLPSYKNRNAARSFRLPKIRSAQFSEAVPVRSGFSDSKRRKEINNYYFSPLVLTDTELFQTCQSIIMLAAKGSSLKLSHQELAVVVDEFITAVQGAYTETSYHNFRHGVDVMQMMHMMINNHMGNGTPFALEKSEPFMLVVIALLHDIGHFGANNAFLRSSKNENAKAYTDRYGEESTLEKFHVAKATEIVETQRLFDADHMDPKLKERILDLMSFMVLWTDMEKHEDFMAEFAQQVHTNKRYYSKRSGDLTTMMRTAPKWAFGNRKTKSRKSKTLPKIYLALTLKICDISNVVRNFEDAKEWTALLNVEFSAMGRIDVQDPHSLVQFQQDNPDFLEKQSVEDTAAFTLTFMATIAVPMAQAFAAVSKSGSWFLTDQMLQNMQIWLSLIKDKNQRQSVQHKVVAAITPKH